ncbi:hypothetical protein TVAG_073380 [Trichomonas vaginalis G3]|uniref:Uncharacterized protein n=1 Tax=Trichomonas vaginalis (strain ATCC PRA-98 / G3) TaxID=412133 RepID=A2FZB2_TRIV3|nr:hypothetical protein TVAGG3_0739350 [Trichomonas vaginalis G3]EAX89761.1 hypothetical protein TVAG_073380 [Trichomonas vaginalis G3]KAI5511774.1 hypothetical protein TVAGG3_0739350 [Trichomonas vaginalis G3]|eukprot:XP_001302691.1 hypothetical protein [Trichomonas vaginalis G3]
MIDNIFVSKFNQIRLTFGLDRDALNFIDQETRKIAENPANVLEYLNNIHNYVHTIPDLARLVDDISDEIKKQSNPKENSNSFNEILRIFKEISNKSASLFVNLMSLFLSNLIPSIYFLDFIKTILQTSDKYTQPLYNIIEVSVLAIQINPFGFLKSLQPVDLQKVSIIYDPSYNTSRPFQFLFLCNFVLTEDELSHLLNLIWLYSFKLLKSENVVEALGSINEKLSEYFKTLSKSYEPEEFHPTKVSKYLDNMIFTRATKYISKPFLEYLTQKKPENLYSNVIQLANSSRFIASSQNHFIDDYNVLYNRLIVVSNYYINILQFSITGDQKHYTQLENAVEYLCGQKIGLQFGNIPLLITKLLKYLGKESIELLNRLTANMRDYLNRLSTDNPEFRVVAKKYFHKSLRKRMIYFKMISLQLYSSIYLNEITESIKTAIEKFGIMDKYKKFLDYIRTVNLFGLIDEKMALAIYYFQILIEMLKEIKLSNISVSIFEYLAENKPPYKDLHGITSCIDIILIRFLRMLNKAIPDMSSNIEADINTNPQNLGTFLFKFTSDGNQVQITSFINPWIQ